MAWSCLHYSFAVYKNSALKVLVEIRKVKEANLWSLIDQSLCLWGQTRYRILDDSIGYFVIASLEAVTVWFSVYGWLRQMWLFLFVCFFLLGLVLSCFVVQWLDYCLKNFYCLWGELEEFMQKHKGSPAGL